MNSKQKGVNDNKIEEHLSRMRKEKIMQKLFRITVLVFLSTVLVSCASRPSKDMVKAAMESIENLGLFSGGSSPEKGIIEIWSVKTYTETNAVSSAVFGVKQYQIAVSATFSRKQLAATETQKFGANQRALDFANQFAFNKLLEKLLGQSYGGKSLVTIPLVLTFVKTEKGWIFSSFSCD